jgi:hypothetical protein
VSYAALHAWITDIRSSRPGSLSQLAEGLESRSDALRQRRRSPGARRSCGGAFGFETRLASARSASRTAVSYHTPLNGQRHNAVQTFCPYRTSEESHGR